jgi:D-glycero-D-manno-heptose 1,7-bisphosphate phosphatase
MSPSGLVILDRDGVINQDSPDFIRSADAWQPLPGAPEAIARLHAAGWRIAVATNQSGIARGLFDARALAAIHDRMEQVVRQAGGRIDHVAFCPHGPDEGCGCRKPAPGLVHEIEAALGISARGAPFVGDALRDLRAARAAGCRPVLVRTGKGGRTERELDGETGEGVMVFDDLAAFADHWLRRRDDTEETSA